jgi:hypothetical protein
MPDHPLPRRQLRYDHRFGELRLAEHEQQPDGHHIAEYRVTSSSGQVLRGARIADFDGEIVDDSLGASARLTTRGGLSFTVQDHPAYVAVLGAGTGPCAECAAVAG